jgi:hypothetical protein
MTSEPVKVLIQSANSFFEGRVANLLPSHPSARLS